ncbi:MAG: hypothetical protein J6T37_01420 [Bacteroidales bacterium]|nr:hypothetical protein [Bacteroidaceae bacterium]MBO5707690.1 hypothetical protein [Bacteroidaceae bacterium]MBO7528255.1 hypothetical protein [Bacteroidales bacterium]MBO7528516.1 hypothetical protein [Bacteroidales bacterium]
MNNFDELKQIKARCLSDIREALPRYADKLNAIDERLLIYVEDALSNNASHSNLYELLGIRKELRLMDSYEMDIPRVQRSLRAIEGQWANGKHQKGGLKFDTPRGNQHVLLMPYQVWCLFGINAFITEADMEREWNDGDELLPTEFVRDGMVWDRRRLTQEAHLFQTRKSGKTEFGAAIDFTEVCFLGPANGQALICAPSAQQSEIAYKAIREFAMQVDPTCSNRMGGKYFRMTRNGLNWQPGHPMKGEIKCMAAGKTSKDGLYAYIVHADEHGQPGYINGHCDMQAAVETCWGSTGPRREKLLLHTTTAGNVKEGPYKDKIEQSVQPSLLKELDYPLGQPNRTPDDSWFAFLLQLDPWEQTEDITKLDDTELFRKVNRSIGITVQPTYYRERLYEATQSDDTKKEVLTKDFNIWQTSRITSWLSGDKIRPLQQDRRVTDCKYQDGWQTFVGLDFSSGDDLFAITYVSINYKTKDPVGRFFADMEAWIVEKTLETTPNRPLYEKWIEQGWLKVCPGEVFDPNLPINALMEKGQYGVNLFAFGYDPAQSKLPINTIKAWLQTLGLHADVIKQMVVPVPQTFMVFNGLIGEVEYYIQNGEPWLSFSNNPMWPWQFGNCRVEEVHELRKLLKAAPNEKIDNIHALIDAFYCFDLSEGRIQQ